MNALLAGNVTFTIETPQGCKIAYRIVKSARSDMYFVRLNGRYIGRLDTYLGQVVSTPNSQLPYDAYEVRLFNRILIRFVCNDHAAYESKGYRVYVNGLNRTELRLQELIEANGDRDLTESEHVEIANLM